MTPKLFNPHHLKVVRDHGSIHKKFSMRIKLINRINLKFLDKINIPNSNIKNCIDDIYFRRFKNKRKG